MKTRLSITTAALAVLGLSLSPFAAAQEAAPSGDAGTLDKAPFKFNGTLGTSTIKYVK